MTKQVRTPAAKPRAKWSALQVFETHANADDDGLWFWRIVARNGNVLADGAEGYTSRASAIKGFRAAQKLMAGVKL